MKQTIIVLIALAVLVGVQDASAGWLQDFICRVIGGSRMCWSY
jgi:hypothetical protein